MLVVSLGENATLKCDIDCFPKPTTEWISPDGGIIFNSSQHTIISTHQGLYVFRNSLIINNVSVEDFGSYTCTVKNKVGKVNFTITLQTKYVEQSTIASNEQFLSSTGRPAIKLHYWVPVIAISGIIAIMLSVALIYCLKRRIKRYNVYEEVNSRVTHDPRVDPSLTNDSRLSRIYETIEMVVRSDCDNDNNAETDDRAKYARPTVVQPTSYMTIGLKSLEMSRGQVHLKEVMKRSNMYDIYEAEAWFIGGKPGTTVVAVKVPKGSVGNDSDVRLRREIDFFYSLPTHPHIIQMISCCTEEGFPPYLLMEYASHGDLRSFIKESNGSLSNDSSFQNQILVFLLNIARGMKHLTDFEVVHGHLKAESILVFPDTCRNRYTCKISNFWYCNHVVEKAQHSIPLKKHRNHCCTENDVLFFGILMWEIFSYGKTISGKIGDIDFSDDTESGYILPRPNECPLPLYKLINSCMEKCERHRPSFKEIVDELSTNHL
ncbi:inactive tyrosine-protein kinase 7-like [Ptychodera flava]|uniref:inactive tyrosine-protein kinase 7-like n=1 Tax=Ptychodera flava TaxID=63121 RepID=UPI00396A286A